MTKARDLADLISAGNPLADGAISVSEVSGAAPTASPTFTGDATFDTDTLVIDSTNNRVGIGTSSPSSPSHVLSTSIPQAKFAYDADRYVALTHSSIFNVSGAGQVNNLQIAARGQGGGNEITFLTGGTDASGTGESERMRVKSDGNLQINSQLHFTDSGSRIVRPTANSLSFDTNNTERMRIDSSGNVLIGGTTVATSTGGLNVEVSSSGSTVAPLTLQNQSTGNNSGVYLTFRGQRNTGAQADYTYIQSVADDTTAGNGSMRFHTLGGGTIAERLRIGSSGELGIGGATYGSSGQVLTSGGSGAAPTWADASSGGMTQITSGTIGTNSSYSFSLGTSWWNTYQYVMFFYDATYQSGDPPSGVTNAFFRLGTLTSSSYTSAGQGGSSNNSTVASEGYLNRTSPGDNNNIFFVGKIYTDGTNTHVYTESSAAGSQNGNGFQSVYAPTIPETFIIYQPYFGSERYRYEGTITFYGVK